MQIFKKKKSFGKDDIVAAYRKAKERKEKLEAEVRQIRSEGVMAGDSVDAISKATEASEKEIGILADAMEYSRNELASLIEKQILEADAKAEAEYQTRQKELSEAQRETGKLFAETLERLRCCGLEHLANAIKAASMDADPDRMKSFAAGMGEHEPGSIPDRRADIKALHRAVEAANQRRQRPEKARRRAKTEADILLGLLRRYRSHNMIKDQDGNLAYFFGQKEATA